MHKKPKAFALITVLMVSLLLLILIMTGLQLTGRNLFTMAKSHDRNIALYAAEAGVYKTLAEIEALDHYPADGLRPRVQLSNNSSYQVHLTRLGDQITLRSEGKAPRAVRTLEVTVTLSPDSYFAVTTEGPIGLADDCFINGVQSTQNPKPGKGNLHTNDSSLNSIVPELRDPSDHHRLSVTGEATAVGRVRATVEGKYRGSADPINTQPVNKSTLLGGHAYNDVSGLPADGIVRGHLRIDQDYEWEGPLHIEEGAVLHVTGSFAVGRGVTGSGTLVVDGEALIRASDRIDLNNPSGVFVYAENGIALVHPQARREELSVTEFAPPTPTPEDPNPQPRPAESQEIFVHDPDPAAGYFAERPTDTEFNLRQGLPLDAPTDLEFFEYYERQMLSPSEAFQLWLDGDESIEYPGLRPEVKTWLEKSRNNPAVRNRLQDLSRETQR